MKKETWVIIALGVVIAILAYTGCNARASMHEQSNLYKAAADSLSITQNKLGQEVASKLLLVANSEKDLLKIKTQDSTIMKLQGVVKKYKGRLRAATVAGTETTDSGTDVTIIGSDTSQVGDSIIVSPIYSSSWDEKWSKGEIIASKDSISRNIKIRNDFEITQGWVSQGIFKPKIPLVNITNHNPNTMTKEVQSFVVEPENKRVSIGVGAMYGIGLLKLRPTIVVGVGVQYSIIKL